MTHLKGGEGTARPALKSKWMGLDDEATTRETQSPGWSGTKEEFASDGAMQVRWLKRSYLPDTTDGNMIPFPLLLGQCHNFTSERNISSNAVETESDVIANVFTK